MDEFMPMQRQDRRARLIYILERWEGEGRGNELVERVETSYSNISNYERK